MIGFIGLGRMGAGMALNLLRAGHDVSVYARDRTKIEAVLAAGAVFVETPALLAAACDVVFTIVGGPADVEGIYLGADGLVNSARPDTVLIDMTTSSADLAARIEQVCSERSIQFLDAPVTGGVKGANAGKLTFMVGGDAATLERVTPILEAMGTKIVHLGGCGAGQTAKQCNQIAVAGILLGAAESLCHAERNGVDIEKMCDILDSGTASSVLIKAMRARLKETGTKAAFSVSQFVKDLRIASDAAAAKGKRISTVDFCFQYFDAVQEHDGGDVGLHVLLEYYKEDRGTLKGGLLTGA